MPARKTSTSKKSITKKRSASRSTAKKSAAKKSAARKATAKKSTAKKSTAKKSTAKKSTAKRSSAKREFDTGMDKRFVRRDSDGQESDDVGRSLEQDQQRDAKTTAERGQGDEGNRKAK